MVERGGHDASILRGAILVREVHSPIETLRRLLLVIVAIGMAGTAADLLLLDHYESGWQLAPLVLIAIGLLVVVWLFINQGFIAVTAMRAIMVCFVVAGFTGILLHYNGNREFQHRARSSADGLGALHKVMKAKAPPALAPASMIQLRLAGFLVTYRHPSLRSSILDELIKRGLTMKILAARMSCSSCDEQRRAGASRQVARRRRRQHRRRERSAGDAAHDAGHRRRA